MGPRSEDRGNKSRPSYRSKFFELQWGRDLKIAEIELPVEYHDPLSNASMGPRSEDRGNDGERRSAARHDRASMGPRSEDRGNWPLAASRFPRSPASMGPRSEDRGNGRDPQRRLQPSLLQWGRDLKIAEMALPYPIGYGSGCRFNGAAI